MDPIAHTLVGLSLAASPVGRSRRVATVTLVLGANLPDLDVMAYALGGDAALGFRRGWTHGFLALALLPLLLTVAVHLWQGRLPGRERLRAGPLFGLATVAILSHPLLDWLNTYGMRWLMPFDGRWFYGDSVFIVDPWLWLVLGCGWLLGRPPSRRLVAGLVGIGGGLAVGVALSQPSALPVLLAVITGWLAAAASQPGGGDPRVRPRLASAGLGFAGMWILVLLGTHAATVARVETALAAAGVEPVTALMVGPVAADPTRWEVVAATPDAYHWGRYSWRGTIGLLLERRVPRPRADDPLWVAVTRHPEIRGFLGWARFPFLEVRSELGGTRAVVRDARYARERSSGFGTVSVLLSDDRSSHPPRDEGRVEIADGGGTGEVANRVGLVASGASDDDGQEEEQGTEPAPSHHDRFASGANASRQHPRSRARSDPPAETPGAIE